MPKARWLLALVITLAAGLPACIGAAPQLDAQTRQQIETHIYNQLAAPFCAAARDVLYPNTLPMRPEPEVDWQKVRGRLPSLELETWESYLTNNAEIAPGLLLDGLLPRCEGHFLACDERYCNPSDAGAASASQIIGFSRLGLNGAGTQALIYVVNDCLECGWGGFFLLRLRDGAWETVDEYMDWVS